MWLLNQPNQTYFASTIISILFQQILSIFRNKRKHGLQRCRKAADRASPVCHQMVARACLWGVTYADGRSRRHLLRRVCVMWVGVGGGVVVVVVVVRRRY